MNKLSCSVSDCMNYSQGQCSLSKIVVDGPGARTASATCCESFSKRNPGAGNSKAEYCGSASAETGISCSAGNCSYNEKSKCHAKSVKVGCCCGDVCSCADTECCTFTEG